MLETLEHGTLDKKDYAGQLEELQLDLMKLQHGLYQQGRRCVILVEGSDAAGKGGMIRRATAHMDPRGYRVHPIGAPTSSELSEHYQQRFWRRLPSAGQLTIFDRSWYGRVLVERVDALIEAATWQRAYDEINALEQQLTSDDIFLIKLFLSIDKDEQLKRFRKRYEQDHKRWKLTPEDFKARQKWGDYQAAYEDMLSLTSTERAPWKVIGANQKLYARIASLQHIKSVLSEHIDLQRVQIVNPEVERLAKLVFDQK